MLTPALSIIKTANASYAVPGQSIGYTVTVTNTGQTPYTGAMVTDSLAGVLTTPPITAMRPRRRGRCRMPARS